MTVQIKPFCSNSSSSNLMTQASYEALTALTDGFGPGILQRVQINKVLRQSSFMAAGLAQAINDLTAIDVLDDGNLSGLVATIKAALAQTVPTGAVMDFLAKTAPSGWVVLSGTIGDASSGAGYANTAAQALFTALWGGFTDGELAVLTSAGGASTRGSSAAADWAAHKRMTLPDQAGRFRRSYGGSSVNVSGNIGAVQADSIISHTHAVTDPGHFHTNPNMGENTATNNLVSGGSNTSSFTHPNTNTATTGISIQSTGGSETRPTNIAYLTCIKL